MLNNKLMKSVLNSRKSNLFETDRYLTLKSFTLFGFSKQEETGLKISTLKMNFQGVLNGSYLLKSVYSLFFLKRLVMHFHASTRATTVGVG